MTFPLTLGPGQSGFLASPDQGKYYFWKGLATSAQYYINKQGIPENEACTWGKPMGGMGNWSPTILGTSWDDLKAHQGFTSLFQNSESYNERLDYDITFTGDGVVSPCAYKRASGQYCQGNKCSSDIKFGCTVSSRPTNMIQKHADSHRPPSHLVAHFLLLCLTADDISMITMACTSYEQFLSCQCSDSRSRCLTTISSLSSWNYFPTERHDFCPYLFHHFDGALFSTMCLADAYLDTACSESRDQWFLALILICSILSECT